MVRNIIKTTAVTLGLISVSLFSLANNAPGVDVTKTDTGVEVEVTPPPKLPPVHPAKQFFKKGGYRKI